MTKKFNLEAIHHFNLTCFPDDLAEAFATLLNDNDKAIVKLSFREMQKNIRLNVAEIYADYVILNPNPEDSLRWKNAIETLLQKSQERVDAEALKEKDDGLMECDE